MNEQDMEIGNMVREDDGRDDLLHIQHQVMKLEAFTTCMSIPVIYTIISLILMLIDDHDRTKWIHVIFFLYLPCIINFLIFYQLGQRVWEKIPNGCTTASWMIETGCWHMILKFSAMCAIINAIGLALLYFLGDIIICG